MPGGVVILHWLAGRFPDHLEIHPRGCGEGVQRRPPRLVDYRDALHLQRERAPVRTDFKTALRDRNHPVESGGCDRRVEVVDLISRDSLSLEQRKSNVGESTSLG